MIQLADRPEMKPLVNDQGDRRGELGGYAMVLGAELRRNPRSRLIGRNRERPGGHRGTESGLGMVRQTRGTHRHEEQPALAEHPHELQDACMAPAITIRDVPSATRDELAARAARSGRSLQEYLLAEINELAVRPDPSDVIARARERVRRTGTRVDAEVILAARDAERR